MSNETELKRYRDNLEKLQTALENGDKAELKRIYELLQPIDVAMKIEDFDEDLLERMCAMIGDENLAEILERAEEGLQSRIIYHLDNYRILFLFNQMQKDNIVDILGNLPIDRRKQLLDLMKEGEKKVISELLGYSPDSAGGIMTTAYIALNGKFTIRQTLNKIKQIAPKTEVIDIIFVINRGRQLVGTANLRDILIADDEATLESIMDEHVISVEPETDQEEVSLLVSKYDLDAIPVVNKRNAMLGIITVDDIIDVIVEEHTEDMLQMAGVNKEESIDSPLGKSIHMRLPWLVVNLVTAFLAAFTVKAFEGTIQQVVALSATMSIVAGMGGNAGTQTLSIMVRGIAMGEVELKKCYKVLRKEVLLGVINGAVTGILTGLIVYKLYGNLYLGLIIFAAMVANLVISGFFGCITPLILKACHADPAISSSIFLTTATDVLGFFIFLGLARIFLPYLMI